MNLFQLEYFRVLAHTQHYTKAAKILSIAQPSLTHSIQSLEKELNVSLFNKKGRNVTLNKYGEFFLQHIDPILNNLDDSTKELQRLADPNFGIVNLDYLYSLGPHFVPNIISKFYQDEACSHIKFNFFEGTTADVIERFYTNKTDLAFTAKIEEKGITCLPMLRDELCLITPLDHPLCQYAEVELSQIAEYPLVSYYHRSGLRKIIDDMFNNSHLAPQIIFQVSNDQTICGFVANNLGIAIIPKFQGISSYDVAILPIKAPACERIIYLSYPTDSYLAPPIAKFKDFALDTFHFPDKPACTDSLC